MATDQLIIFVNGRKVEVRSPDPEMTLLQYLRDHLQLTGTKAGCGEGGCGACTVMLSRYLPHQDTIHHYSVVACLTPLCSLHGVAVTTVEGIGNLSTRLHPVQEKIASAHGSQCGFCTPGFVMSMYTLLRNHSVPTAKQLETALDGNLCRCTGYRPIIDGFRPFTQGLCGKGENCCMNRGASKNDNQVHGADGKTVENGDVSMVAPLYDPSQEPIFPPYLKTHGKELWNQSLKFCSERVTWYRPTSLSEVLDIKKKHPDCKFVVGNTEIGIETKFQRQVYPVLVSLTHVQELLAVQCTQSGILFGASVTLATMDTALKEAIEELPEHQTQVFAAVVEMLQWFGGTCVRNVATVGGNLMTASPISDLNPLWLASGATLRIISTEGKIREVVMDDTFITGYRQTALLPSEVLLSVSVPYTQQNEYFYGFKQSYRKEDDTAIVNAGMRVLLTDDVTVKDVTLVFGGMAPRTVMATKTSHALIGRKWNEELLSKACELLAEELPLSAEAPGGMIQYRRSLTVSFFFKCYLDILQRLKRQNKAQDVPLQSSYLSATQSMERDLPGGTQVFDQVTPDQSPNDALHRPLMYPSAYKQATGEAIYVDDLPREQGELYMGCVISTQAHASLLKVDPSPALAMQGVVDFISHRDVPGPNVWGDGNEIFAKDKVYHQGQLIGAVLAENKTLAQRAAATVIVEYQPLDPVITIKEAIAKESYFPPPSCIQRGDVTAAMVGADHVVEGEVHTEAQEHFYLETFATLVKPGEDGEMEVFASTQYPSNTQENVARTLNVPEHKIMVRTKRVGGAFGGKQSRTLILTLPLAVAANKLKRAVRCSLDREEDMMMTGTSHPFLVKYKAGFNSDGRVQALDVSIYINAGCTQEISRGIMDKAMFNTDNCYNIPHLRTWTMLCKTNLPSNAAFRGFGGPAMMVAAETWISHVASYLNMAPHKVREINFYKEGDFTHYNQKLENITLQSCWQECIEKSDYHSRRQQVDMFNRENRWRKRGLALIPTKYGMGFTFPVLNQGGALVLVYLDGSVLLSHGGVEMGQGLHTKMIQVASRVLRIPAFKISTSETNTSNIPNASVTAASMSSDIYGYAVKDACEKLRGRLDQYAKFRGDTFKTWEELIQAAYMDRIKLTASGFHSVPDLDYDVATNRGRVFTYFCYGAACSEVELDCLTGEHKVLRTDIVMDAGQSLNPTVDIGQVEGAFIQGYGFMMLEQYKVQPDGTLLTRGPGTYKIPALSNLPAHFNVSLLRNSFNPRAVFSSKNTGEPPLFLAASVLHAAHDAVTSARREAGLPPFVILDVPATPDTLRLACADRFTQQFDMSSENGPVKPWYVEL